MTLVGPEAAGLLATLHAACFDAAARWDASAMRTLLDMPGSFGCVIAHACGTRDGGPLGDAAVGLALARVAADEAELLTIGVLPDARRRGMARRLLGALCDTARARGAARLFLEVSVDNDAARSFYGAAEFDTVGRRRRYYEDGSDALVLAATLGPAR